MKLETILIAALAISLWGNFALIRIPAESIQQKSAAPVSDQKRKKLTAQLRTRPAFSPRNQTLRQLGLSEELIAAALVPEINRHFREQFMQHETFEEVARAASRAKQERHQLIWKLFGSHGYTENIFDPDPVELSYDFDQ